MACTERRFFGVPLVEQSPDELAGLNGSEIFTCGGMVPDA